MALPNTQVPAEPQNGGIPAQSGTPAQSPVTAQTTVTPTQTAADAEKTRLLKEYQDKLVKQETDIRNLKSTFNQRESKLTQEHQAREKQFQEELRRVQLSTMDDDEKKNFERELDRQHLQELQEENQRLAAERQNLQDLRNTEAFFISKGVPPSALDYSGDINQLSASGYAWMENEINTLRAKVAQPATTTAVPPKTSPAAPPVDTTAGSPLAAGPTWADVDKAYPPSKGGREQFYKELNSGAIPADRLPLRKEVE